MLDTVVEFRSDSFPPVPREEETINPGRFGKRLAEFLRGGLREACVPAGEPVAEDWGWRLTVNVKGQSLWIGCGNLDENLTRFICFIEPHTLEIRRAFRRIDVSQQVALLRDVLDRILSSNVTVCDKRWYTHDAFNSPL